MGFNPGVPRSKPKPGLTPSVDVSMKRSKPLSASILIALALLLSGTSSGSDEKHQPQATHHRSAAKNQSAYSTQPPTIIVEPAPVKIIQPAPAAEKQTTK